MHKDTRQRYQTWEEFSHDLAQAFRSKQIKAPKRDFAESEKFDTLRELPFFADFSDVEIWGSSAFLALEQRGTRRHDHAGRRPGNFFCFLVEGELKVTKNGHILNLLTPGECFGEMAVIGKGMPTRGADVIALTDAKIVTVKGEALRQASETCRMHFYPILPRSADQSPGTGERHDSRPSDILFSRNFAHRPQLGGSIRRRCLRESSGR